jgi:hypothetical protein
LALDASYLGSFANDPAYEDVLSLNKLLRRAKKFDNTMTIYRRLQGTWAEMVILCFSDAGQFTRRSGPSQAGGLFLLAEPAIFDGETAVANMIDLNSSKIGLTIKATFDSKLHAAQHHADVMEGLPAAMHELRTGEGSASRFCKLPPDQRQQSAIIIDAHDLHTRLENAFKTERKVAVFPRQSIESLTRCSIHMYWVYSGRMIADGLTKRWAEAHGELLLAVLETGLAHITYCEGSWRKKLDRQRGTIRALRVPDAVWCELIHDAESAHDSTLSHRVVR